MHWWKGRRYLKNQIPQRVTSAEEGGGSLNLRVPCFGPKSFSNDRVPAARG